MTIGHLKGCTLSPKDGHPLCYEGSRCLGSRPIEHEPVVAGCHAWADGQHCYTAYYEHPGLNDGDGKVMSTHGVGPAACKRCLCGAEVKRT